MKKDIMKGIQSLENRGSLLKRITTKITSQEEGFLNSLRPLMTAVLPFITSVLGNLFQSVLLPFGLSGMAADAAIQKKIFWSGTAALIISNEAMEDIIKIVKSLEKSGLLIKGISETIKNETKV